MAAVALVNKNAREVRALLSYDKELDPGNLSAKAVA